MTRDAVRAAAGAAFLQACRLDVAVRKPGNVSVASAGHRMEAEMFLRSARAAAPALFEPEQRVGVRIERAVAATWAAVGCNTNLGIVLLCAPIAMALDGMTALPSAAALRAAVARVLDDLDVDDAAGAFRAIAMANPGGLGRVDAQDVHAAPTLDLRGAMALAAPRDRIAAQYENGLADVFSRGLDALPPGFDPRTEDAGTDLAVQQLFVTLLAAFPDAHIVRKHGEAVAHSVMRAAQAWPPIGHDAAAQSALVRWDESLKLAGINPGTTADLTVATLFVAGLARTGTERDT